MPHIEDRDGTKLEIGDTVYVPCTVTGLGTEDEYANVKLQLETHEKIKPEAFTSTLYLNGRQVVFVAGPEAEAEEEAA